MIIKRALILATLSAACVSVAVTAASARECKTESIVAEGSIKSLRDLEAYPSSLFAWRAAVKEKFGGEWNSWRYAQEATVDCREIKSDKQSGWICKRTAKPCKDTLSTVVEEVTKKANCKEEALSSYGSKKNTEEAAIKEAQSGWSIDTKKKYGADWAKWENASGGDQDCRKVGGGFQCIAVATPCMPK
jgi:hypothetical protein